MVHGFYDLQDPECNIKRLHYKAGAKTGFQVSKIEDQECEDNLSKANNSQEQTQPTGSDEEV